MTLLATRELDVQIAGRRICSGFTHAFGAGEVWAVLGRNGAGKTTLLHTLAGLRPAHRGSVAVDDRELGQWDGRALARRRGVLLQDSQDPFPATVQDTVLAGRHPHLSFWALEGNTDHALAQQALRDVDMDGAGARLVTTLSGGERRRVAIATLLTQDPAIWLLDEPSNHLDLHHQVRLLSLLVQRASKHGGLILMSLHDVNLALRFCTHALLLSGNGDVIAGRADAVMDAAGLERTYGHAVREVRGADGARAWLPV